MRYIGLAAALVALINGSAMAAETKMDLSDQAVRQGYSIGYQLGNDFKTRQIQVDVEAMAAGTRAGMAGSEPALAKEEMYRVLTDIQRKVEEDRRAKMAEELEENRLAGEKFLAENGAREEVTTLASGLQYKVLQEGDGPKPEATSTVTVHYRGTLPDGTEFDSSYQRGEPATFQVNRVVPGWTEALQLMPTGSKWMLYLPSELAYGERGAPPRIGPNQVLLFEVELIKVD